MVQVRVRSVNHGKNAKGELVVTGQAAPVEPSSVMMSFPLDNVLVDGDQLHNGDLAELTFKPGTRTAARIKRLSGR